MVSMQRIMVVFDSSPTSWEAAFSAFHVAVRLDTPLIGALLLEDPRDADPELLLHEFESGARAAGAGVSSMMLPAFTLSQIRSQKNLSALFISQSTASATNDRWRIFQDMIQHLPMPVWIVPGQRPIRRMLVVQEKGVSSTGAREYGALLARRLNLEKRPAVGPEGDIQPGGNGSQVLVVVISSAEDLLHAIVKCQPDLVVSGKPGGHIAIVETCLKAGCTIAVCPS